MRKLGYIVLGLVIGCAAHGGNLPDLKTVNQSVKPDALKNLRPEMKGIGSIIFVQRGRYKDAHWYASIGYYANSERLTAYASGAQLCRLDLKTGKVSILLETEKGCIRDPQVHYDGKKMVFAWRKADTRHYDLYEMNLDGTGKRQLTTGPYDDYEPSYLPDGGLVFVSTRCRRWVNCWTTQVGTIYRCDKDGKNIRMLSCNIEQDNTPAVLHDGRIMYMRWEYVDRSQVDFHHLWTMNPDGTNQKIYYGNERPGHLFIGARPIPGSDRVLGVFSPHHGMNEQFGNLAFWTSSYGPDDPKGQEMMKFPSGKPVMADPWPLSEECIIATDGKRMVVVEKQKKGFYGARVLYEMKNNKQNWIVQEPRPVMVRKPEGIIADQSDVTKTVGHHLLIDVYNSQNMKGVKRGEIKRLLILETLPKPVNLSSSPDLTSWLGTFTLERILGTVPVEADGSAFFELPANRPVFYVALDKDNLSVKRMQSFTSVVPGEMTTCLGCHESRSEAPSNSGLTKKVMALNRPPAKIEPIPGVPDVPDFIRDVQPVLDKHCVKCHNVETHKGNLSLEADMGPRYSISYYALLMRNQIADGRNGYGNRPPRTIGSSASPLLRKMEGGHPPSPKGSGVTGHKVKVSKAEWMKVWAWLEAAAPFCGTYGGLGGHNKYPAHRFHSLARKVINSRCAGCHKDGGKVSRIPVSYDRKELPRRRRMFKRPTAKTEGLVIENDPMARFSWDVLLNASRPEKSAILLAPLSKRAGGRESCGQVFTSETDEDYKVLRDALIDCRKRWLDSHSFGTPNFRVNKQYIREMVRFGVLSKGVDPKSVDPYATDRKYWDLFDLSKGK